MSARLLFIPVSSPKGIGEYMRSLAIARAVKDHDEHIDIRFVLSQQAPYRKSCPFPVYLCPTSATKHTTLVNQFIEQYRPNVVIFDAAGRASQLKYARSAGAKTVFICQHNKKLRKGLGLRRLRYTDQIWSVQPEFAVKPLSLWSQLKLKMLHKSEPIAIGPVFQLPEASHVAEVLARFQLQENQYILVNAGSGGHHVDGKNAGEVFAQVAQRLSEVLQEKIVVVYGPNFTGSYLSETNCLIIPALEPQAFNALLSRAQGALLSGGSALLQAISYGLDIVACAVSKDQHERIDACVRQGLITKSSPDANALSTTALRWLTVKTHREKPDLCSGLEKAKTKLLELSSR